MVTVTSVGRLGQVTGIYAKGPPNRNTYDQTPSNYANFNGKLSEDGLKFDTGGWKHEYRIMPDGSMVGRLRFDGPPPFAGSINLERVATGTPLEPSVANPFDGVWDIVRHGTIRRIPLYASIGFTRNDANLFRPTRG
jgi:hypothetical protein